jgi:hypothetical protein
LDTWYCVFYPTYAPDCEIFEKSTVKLGIYQQSLEAFRRHCDFIEPSDKNWILGGKLQSILKETTI